MLPRSARLSVVQFNLVMEKGKATHSPFFVVRVLKMEGATRIAATVPVKVCKKATSRNKLRRQIYEAVQLVRGSLVSGVQAIVFAKKGAETASFEDLSKSLKEIFVKAGLMK